MWGAKGGFGCTLNTRTKQRYDESKVGALLGSVSTQETLLMNRVVFASIMKQINRIISVSLSAGVKC